MTIEIHNPELESLLQQRIRAGNFSSVEDMLLETFRGAHSDAPAEDRTTAGPWPPPTAFANSGRIPSPTPRA